MPRRCWRVPSRSCSLRSEESTVSLTRTTGSKLLHMGDSWGCLAAVTMKAGPIVLRGGLRCM